MRKISVVEETGPVRRGAYASEEPEESHHRDTARNQARRSTSATTVPAMAVLSEPRFTSIARRTPSPPSTRMPKSPSSWGSRGGGRERRGQTQDRAHEITRADQNAVDEVVNRAPSTCLAKM